VELEGLFGKRVSPVMLARKSIFALSGESLSAVETGFENLTFWGLLPSPLFMPLEEGGFRGANTGGLTGEDFARHIVSRIIFRTKM